MSAPHTPATEYPEPAIETARHASPPAGEGRQAWLRRRAAGAAALAVLLVYLAMGAPGAWWGDGQELACAAWTLGIPHPTGYPLYTLTGHAVMKLLRWMDPGRALTITSALLLAAAVGVLITVFQRVLSSFNRPHSLLPAIGAGLFVAFAGTVWEHATFAEVYPLTFFFGALVLRVAWVPEEARPGPGRAAALGALLGVGLLNHYSLLALGPLAALAMLRWTLRGGRRGWRLPLVSFLCFAGCLAGYVYLPWRAAANPPLNWGDPSNLARLKWVLTGGQFKEVYITHAQETPWHGILRWVAWWGKQWLPERWGETPLAPLLGAALLALALGGLFSLTRRRWELGLGLLGALGATMTYGALYHIPDIDAYFMIALPAAMAGWIVAVQGLTACSSWRPDRGLGRLLPLAPALLAVALMAANYKEHDKSWDHGAEIYGAAVLKALPPGALVLTGGDSDIYSLWYAQMVRGQRPDVTVYGSKFLISGWYQRYFDRPGRPKIPVYIEDRSPLETTQIYYNVKFFRGVLFPNFAQGRPVYATYPDFFLSEYLRPKPVAQLFPPGYEQICDYPAPLLPGPVLYRLEPNPALARLSEAELEREFQDFARRKSAGLGGMMPGF